MKKNNKKGFTIVELVIVIAVIAILAAVLIPTFTGVTERAKESAAMQNAKNAWTEYVAENADQSGYKKDICIESTVDGTVYYFHVVDGKFNEKAVESHDTAHTGFAFAQATIVDGILVINA